VSRNSGNSSFPPSMDAQPGRARPKPRARRRADGSRAQGKQPGAPGSHLAWSASPDERVACFSQGRCRCGVALAGRNGHVLVEAASGIERANYAAAAAVHGRLPGSR
jgi:hypothetical protein